MPWLVFRTVLSRLIALASLPPKYVPAKPGIEWGIVYMWPGLEP